MEVEVTVDNGLNVSRRGIQELICSFSKAQVCFNIPR
jgi:hypothetical protein